MSENNHENNIINNEEGEKRDQTQIENAGEQKETRDCAVQNKEAGPSTNEFPNEILTKNPIPPKVLTESSNEIISIPNLNTKENNNLNQPGKCENGINSSLNISQTANKSVKFSDTLFHKGSEENTNSGQNQNLTECQQLLIKKNLIRFRNIILKVMETDLYKQKAAELRIREETLPNSSNLNQPISLKNDEPASSPALSKDNKENDCNSLENMTKQLSSSLEKSEKKSKTSIITRSDNDSEHHDEAGTVGDNQTTITEAHITCECETSCAGAAVPLVVSFVASELPPDPPAIPDSTSNETNEAEILNLQDNDAGADSTGNSNNSKNTEQTNKIEDTSGNGTYSAQDTVDGSEQCTSSGIRDTNSKSDILAQNNKIANETANVRRSLIPKLIRNGRRSRDSSVESKPKASADGENIASASSYSPETDRSTDFDSKLDIVQAQLKVTTSTARQRIQSKKRASFLEKEVTNDEQPETSKPKSKDKTKLINEFYKSVTEIKKIADVLSKKEEGQNQSQSETISNLYSNILKIKNIANRFEDSEDQKKLTSSMSLDDQKQAKKTQLKLLTEAKSQDNKISIKVQPTKLNSKKKCVNKVMECKTDLVHESNVDIDELRSQASLVEHIIYEEKKNVVKRTDSMDGIFIPSEPPTNTMDDEEEDGDGLDITITFKELKSAAQEADSHLSVCFSDLSAEALGKLKRCPKNFTLRMDFLNGKMVFHTGKALESNSSFADATKNADELVVDTKQSDMISLKPSTECSFASQIIPVENVQKKSSMSILKLADPEVFSVVSLPFVVNRPSLTTRSCSAVKSNLVLSKRLLLEQAKCYRSLPQIESLQNIFYDSVSADDASRTSRNPHRWLARFERIDNVYNHDCDYLTSVRTAFLRLCPAGTTISQIGVVDNPNRHCIVVQFLVNCGCRKNPRRRRRYVTERSTCSGIPHFFNL